MVSHYRISTKDQKKIALRICSSLDPKIVALKVQLMDEFKTQFLEIQKGEIKQLAAPQETDKETSP